VRRRATGVHRALRDALVVEVGDLLAQVVILEQCRPPTTRLEGVIGVVQPSALRGREVLPLLTSRGLPAADGISCGRTQIGATLIWLRWQRFPRGGRFVERRRLRTGCARDVFGAVLLQTFSSLLDLVLGVFDNALDGLFGSAVLRHGAPSVTQRVKQEPLTGPVDARLRQLSRRIIS
jgi:hypothetical protein